MTRRSPSGRACGPSDLSRDASQPEALVPNAGSVHALYEAAVLAEKFIDAILSYCGTGLEVANWHLNGDLEPFDNFITANQHGDRDELETLRAAIAQARGEA